jgi:NAD(P)-dependent dehydrogenase (short-subunit alcohol dehydrogenase family)
MAKAAFNMMTRTLAAQYARDSIYMNAVDPGWVSFQQPSAQQSELHQAGLVPPFDTEDATARLLDPVYRSLRGEKPLLGKLLKDFKEVDW